MEHMNLKRARALIALAEALHALRVEPLAERAPYQAAEAGLPFRVEAYRAEVVARDAEIAALENMLKRRGV